MAERFAYAAGLMVLHWRGLNEVSHSGSTAGYRAWLRCYPEQGLSVTVLCNVSSANATELGHQVAEVYLASVIRQHAHETSAPDPSVLEAKAGLYRSVHDHQTLSIRGSGRHAAHRTPWGPDSGFGSRVQSWRRWSSGRVKPMCLLFDHGRA